jgi:23S rRNA (adenine2030-N6)-methyltransferase
MLSYRHGFHAGNAADVLKHAVLAFCLDYLVQKEKPLLCVDTHAGAALYRLGEGFSGQKREWEKGIGKLVSGPVPALLEPYLRACSKSGILASPTPKFYLAGSIEPKVRRARKSGILRSIDRKIPPLEQALKIRAAEAPVYPGSPLIMARLLRPADRLVCFELHPADYAACTAALAGRAEVRRADGFAGLKGLLPPPSRRGLCLIDPPYEIKDDYVRLPETLSGALRRFPRGLYIAWYPLLRNPPAARAPELPARLMELYRGNRCRVELYTGASPSPRGMYGSGLVIYNPPWTLKTALEESLPLLGRLIGTGPEGWLLECNPSGSTVSQQA